MPNLVLYRKYRPQKFSEVLGQDHIKTTLANAVAHNRVGHAYLFVGPRGVGKTTLARIFARAINCTDRQGSDPCNECEVCKSFFTGSSLDLLEIDAASHTGVDNIRELIDHLQFAPSKAAYKVIIIDEVHMLSKGAFNALLKTLEEPPAHAVFILATTEVHKVLATIISRTQRFDFRKISVPDLIKLLKYVAEDNKVSISEEASEEIARAADGSFRDGLSLLDQVINFSDGKVTLDLAEEVLGLTGSKTLKEFSQILKAGKTKDAVGFISKLSYSGKDLHQFAKDFLESLRKDLLMKINSGEDVNDAVNLIELFQKAESEMKWAAIQSLPLELAAVEATVNLNPSPDALFLKPDSASTSSEGRGENSSSLLLGLPLRGTSGQATGEGNRPQENQQNDRADEGFAQILSHWPQILEKIKDYNHSLIASLKLAVPKAIAGRELILIFPYKFHKDVIDARKNRIIVDQVIEDVTGLKIMTKPLVEKEWTEEKNEIATEKGNALESALKIMGGKVE